MVTKGNPIRVLVVDDSALMRKMIGDIISEAPGLELAGQAKNGLEALEQAEKLKPDVITLDLEMPKMDGLQALARLMTEKPIPTVILSAHAKEGADSTLLALELGAVDFVTKPSGSISLDIDRVREQLVERIRVAAAVDLSKLAIRKPAQNRTGSAPSAGTIKTIRPLPFRGRTDDKTKVVAIGSSTGGTRALAEIMPRLPAELDAAYLLVQHMPLGFTKSLAERLNARSKVSIKEAEDGDTLTSGQALLAPAGWHLRLAADGREVELSKDPPRHGVRPSVDVMMESLAQYCQNPMVAVILTGMGHDGAKGLSSIKKKGGRTLAEDKSTCVVWGMPRAAVETGAVDEVLPLEEIPGGIVRACRQKASI
jgi:two-component system chemotaxis response regulator CheB